MRRRADWRKILIQCVSIALFLALGLICFAEVLMPETGSKTKKNARSSSA